MLSGILEATPKVPACVSHLDWSSLFRAASPHRSRPAGDSRTFEPVLAETLSFRAGYEIPDDLAISLVTRAQGPLGSAVSLAAPCNPVLRR
jgi:hypothetical protein